MDFREANSILENFYDINDNNLNHLSSNLIDDMVYLYEYRINFEDYFLFNNAFAQLQLSEIGRKLFWQQFAQILFIIVLNRNKAVIGRTAADQHTSNYIRETVQDLMRQQHTKYIRTLSNGNYFTTFLIGSNVLKAGNQLHTFQIPPSTIYAKTYFRKEIQIYNNFYSHFEYQEFCDNIGITQEEVLDVMYQLYLEGIQWTDPRQGNIGYNKEKELKLFDLDYLFPKSTILTQANHGPEYNYYKKLLETKLTKKIY